MAITIESLKANTDLWNRMLFYFKDLLKADKKDEINPRLFTCNHHYLSYYYFTDEEMETIIKIDIDGVNLGSIIDDALQIKYSDKENIHVCTSHDLFPIYQKIFHLEKNFHKQSSLIKLHKAYIKNKSKVKKSS